MSQFTFCNRLKKRAKTIALAVVGKSITIEGAKRKKPWADSKQKAGRAITKWEAIGKFASTIFFFAFWVHEYYFGRLYNYT